MEFGTCLKSTINQTSFFLCRPITRQNTRYHRPCLSRTAPASMRCRATAEVHRNRKNSSFGTLEKVKTTSANSSCDLVLSSLTAACLLDGCYWDKIKALAPFMSEFGLIRFRVLVEIEWLLKLSEVPEIPEVPDLSPGAKSFLHGLIDGFSLDDAMEVKEIERVTNHDVKAVEYFLKQRCQSHEEISKVLEFFHFACTSEDINNLAHALTLKEAISSVILPVMDELISTITNIATKTAHVPMLSRNHGQPATPTMLGKEMANFSCRLYKTRQEISQIEMRGKFAGAVGNYNAHLVAYPDVNWPQVAEDFVTSLGLSFNPYVSQVQLETITHI
ncbi:unnamed protein product [Cuscuta campestris]|uniref:Fumarate lyase N-terminal domain-containing protein n=1 Tax=Cuscuta campestris TaxID=132261 RepID=A0A484MM72_9ASTE|nr:unnamed protein product [Cuscuta campestris]